MTSATGVNRRLILRNSLAGCAAALLAPAFGCSQGTSDRSKADGELCKPASRRGRSAALTEAVNNVVIANRILAYEGVVDAYGHVSVRHPEIPDRFLISRSLPPEMVTPDDIMEIQLDGAIVGDDDRKPYLERYIHGGIYKSRPEINGVCHAHATEVLPFTIGTAKLRPVLHSTGVIGENIPVWDMRDKFGDTNLLVVDEERANDLAAHLGGANVILMRGHGFSAASANIIELVRICIYLKLNARVLLDALKIGEVTYLSPGEIKYSMSYDANSSAVQRAWKYWAERAGCSALLAPVR